MNRDLFNNLPSEIIIDVLLRLPVRSVVCCKCVCKSWLRLVETKEFAKAHLSKSVPGRLVRAYSEPRYSYLFLDGEDGVPYDDDLSEGSKAAAMFNVPIHTSSDGLLFLCHRNVPHCAKYICNPITRDCIELHYPQEFVHRSNVYYVFGRSKTTGQHKVVGIRHVDIKSECRVYTLGTGCWRTIAAVPTFKYYKDCPPAFVDGNLHWLVLDEDDIPWISCFNLETELFTTFSTPILRHRGYFYNVCAFGNYLCLNGNWVMKNYGVEDSWTKEFIGIAKRSTLKDAILHTPSFLSLKSFVGETVFSL